MTDICKATITFGNVKIVLEGPRDFIDTQVEKYSDANSASKSESKNLKGTIGMGERQAAGLSERELIAEKQPKGHHEIVIVLAHCLTEAGQPEFGEDEIRRAYIRAGVRPPKVVGQALRDAKNNHDFLEPAGKGKYRLSAHGERTVLFDLPRRGDN